MANESSTLDALRNTSRGKLRYDGGQLDKKALQDILDEVAIIPKFPPRSPQVDNTEKKSKVNDDEEEKKDVNKYVKESHSSDFSPNGMIVEKKIYDYETGWDRKILSPIEEKRRQFEEHRAMLTQQAEQQLWSVYMSVEKRAEQEAKQALSDEQARKEEVQKKQLKLRENHLRHKQLLDAKLQEAKKREKEEEEEKQRKLKELQERITSILSSQNEVRKVKQAIEQLYSTCPFKDVLTDGVKNAPKLLDDFIDKLERLVQQAKSGVVTEAHVLEAKEISSKSASVREFVTAQIDAITKKNKDAVEKKEKEEKAAAAAKQAADAAKASAAASIVSRFSDPEGLKYYQTVINQVREAEKVCEPVLNDPQLKKFKFDLQKAINIPVNAISPTSGSHLKDKLQRINGLLSGQAVEVGGKRVSATQHAAGTIFCKDLFAKKIVKQGDEQVSSSHDSAFAIAAVTVGVWCEFSDVGNLLMGHFFSKCPYLVPYYIPKKEGQTSEDYYKTLGYNYADGEIEKQDKFLKRMTGYMRLWASIVVSTVPPGPPRAHPQGPEQGWRWLTRVLNIEPRPDITATLLLDFLTVAGNTLMKVYSKQFIKVLQYLISDYLPRIRKVTPDGSGGPVTRLEVFLDKILKTRQIAAPQGILTQNFWFT